MPERRSSLQIIAEICKRLEEGISEEGIKNQLEIEDDEFPAYVKFALENDWITEQNEKYSISKYGKEVLTQLQSSV